MCRFGLSFTLREKSKGEGGCLGGLIFIMEAFDFDCSHPLHAMLEGNGGVSHGRLVGSTLVVLRWCFEQSNELPGGRRVVRGDVHSIVIEVDGSVWGSSRGRLSLLRGGETVFTSADVLRILSS